MKNYNHYPKPEVQLLIAEDQISVTPAVAETESRQLGRRYIYDSLTLKLNKEAEILLTYDNAVMSFFANPEFNHIKINDYASQRTLIAPLPTKMQDYLLGNNFPFVYKPLPSDIEMDWYQHHKSHQGIQAINEFLANYENN